MFKAGRVEFGDTKVESALKWTNSGSSADMEQMLEHKQVLQIVIQVDMALSVQ